MEPKKPINTGRVNHGTDKKKFPRANNDENESLEKDETLNKKSYRDRSHGRTHDSAINVDNPGTQ